MAARLIPIDFACNDPDSGSFEGRAFMASFMECELMNDDFVRGVAFKDDRSAVRIHRKRFPYRTMKQACGNWCWNRYWFDRATAIDLLKTMRKSGKWSLDGGPVRLCDWWERQPTRHAIPSAASPAPSATPNKSA